MAALLSISNFTKPGVDLSACPDRISMALPQISFRKLSINSVSADDRQFVVKSARVRQTRQGLLKVRQ